MDALALVVVIWAVIAVMMYVLYINGYMIVSLHKALFFRGDSLGIFKKNSTKAKFSACSGSLRRIIKFKESGTYEFSFSPDLEKGNVSVEIQNSEKEILLLIDKNTSGRIHVQSGQRYHIIVRFKKAKGKYHLGWNMV